MRLFTENFDYIITYGDKNILQVEKYEEIFFDVFEISIKGKTFISEKIGEYEKFPIVLIPVEINESKTNFPFVLKKGKFEIIFNENNKLNHDSDFDNINIPIISERNEHVEEFSKEIFEKQFIDVENEKDELLEYIENAKQLAKHQSDEYRISQLKILEDQKTKSKKELEILLDSSKESWFGEFDNISNNIKTELLDVLNTNNSEIRESIDLKLEVISDINSEKIDEKIDKGKQELEILFNSSKESWVEDFGNISNNIKTELLDVLNINNSEIIESIDLKLEAFSENNLETINQSKEELEILIDISKESSLEKINTVSNNIKTELLDVLNINNSEIKESIDSIFEVVDEKIDQNKNYVTTYYNEKIDIVENKLLDLSDENRNYFVGLINESRDNLLKEIKAIKTNNNVEYIIENSKTGVKKEIDITSIKNDLQKEITSKISDEVIALRKHVAYYGGGGGTVAQQFADGGTMNGTLNINGQILSGGVDIATLFTGGGNNQPTDRLVNGSNQVVLSSDANLYLAQNGGIVFDDGTVQTTAYQGANTELITLSSNWNDVYTNVQSNSANWNSAYDTSNSLNLSSGIWNDTYTNVQSNSSNWNSAYDTSNSYQNVSSTFATIEYTDSTFFQLSGGTITGNTKVKFGDLTVYGNISATGSISYANTFVSTASSLRILANSIYPTPGLYVSQQGSGDIASFYDVSTNREVLHIGGSDGYSGVGVNTSYPNKDFTVIGDISATGIIYNNNYNSSNWNSAYNTSNSLNLSSGLWNNVYTNVQSNSANWNSAYNTSNSLNLSSGLWNNVYTNVQSNSSNWNTSYDTSNSLNLSSGIWNDTYTNVQSNSANWNSAYNIASSYQNISSTLATVDFTNNKFLPLSGGSITGQIYADYYGDNGSTITANGDNGSTITGTSNNGTGVYGTGGYSGVTGDGIGGGYGVLGTSVDGIAGFFSSSNNAVVASAGTGIGIAASSIDGYAIDASSINAVGLNINSTNGTPLVATLNNSSGTIAQFYNESSRVFSVLASGSIQFASGSSTLTLAAATTNTNARTITFPAANGTVALKSTTLGGYGITDAVTLTDLRSLSAEWVGGNNAYTAVNANSANWNSAYTTYSANSSTYLVADNSSTIIGLSIFI